MNVASQFTITLTKREIALAATNSGCVVKLPAPTTEIIIKVVEQEENT